jgi:hypothetical protein
LIELQRCDLIGLFRNWQAGFTAPPANKVGKVYRDVVHTALRHEPSSTFTKGSVRKAATVKLNSVGYLG